MRPAVVLFAFVLFLLPAHAEAQAYLSKTVSVTAKQKKLGEVLDIIGKQGGFYFSYNSNLVNADSIVSVEIWRLTVREVLDKLLDGKFEYKEIENHVIIQTRNAGQYWYISGYVTDGTTGERVRDVSVFESTQLVASLTNEQGYFRLKLKDKTPTTNLYIRKSLYRDTAIDIKPGVSQEVTVSIQPKPVEMDSIIISSRENNVEGTWFGRVFLSSKQRIQSINLSKFFVDMPFQGSIIPGLSSQGRMSSQASNILSINMIGGYTAGARGVEIGSVFNISKNDVKYLQAAGVVNIVGGNVRGLQAAGVHNNVLDSCIGLQAAGVSNIVRKEMTGVQASGIFNLTIGKVKGAQLSGVINTSIDTLSGIQAAGVANAGIKKIKGVQMAGVINTSAGEIHGLQASGVLNYATRIKGVQFGLVNVAHESSGVSIGLFSFVTHGYHRLVLSGNEIMPYNASIKTGTRWLYNIYTAGASAGTDKAYLLGMGFGSDLPISKRLSISPELTGNVVYLGNWAEVNSLVRFRANLSFRVIKWIHVFAGPSYNMYWDNKQPKIEGYKTEVLPAGYKRNEYSYNLGSWIGWQTGVAFF